MKQAITVSLHGSDQHPRKYTFVGEVTDLDATVIEGVLLVTKRSTGDGDMFPLTSVLSVSTRRLS